METILKKLGKVAITVDKYLWSKDKEYDKLTIVRYNENGVSYLSRKQVPAGTLLTDTDYWFPFTKDMIQGDSAYDIAVKNGYEGTEEEWLATLVGPEGEPGPQGDVGPTGATGPKGDKGDPGTVIDGVTVPNSLEALSTYTPEQKAAVVPSGNIIDEITTITTQNSEDIEDLDLSVNGGTDIDVIDGKTSSYKVTKSTGFIAWNESHENYYEYSHTGTVNYILKLDTNITNISGYIVCNATPGSKTQYSPVVFTKSSAWETVPEGYTNLGLIEKLNLYGIALTNIMFNSKSSARKNFNVTPPAEATRVFIWGYGDSNINISVTVHTPITGLNTKMEDITTRVEELEAKDLPEFGDTNTDQDCLLLRKYIKDTFVTDGVSYYFAAPSPITSYEEGPYLDAKIHSVPDGKHFIFITDTHWQSNPAKNSTYIASYVQKRLGGCPVFFGGDAIDSADGKYLAAAAISQYADEFYSAFGDNGFWVQGNHDSNKLGTDGSTMQADGKVIDDIEIYKRTVARNADKVTFDDYSISRLWEKDDEGEYKITGMTDAERLDADGWLRLHYHVDDEKHKIRYIVYETGCYSATAKRFFKDPEETAYYQMPALYRWLARTLKSTPEDYDIVIFGHTLAGRPVGDYTSDDSDGNNLIRLVIAFRQQTSAALNMRKDHVLLSPFHDLMYGTAAQFVPDFSDTNHHGRVFMVCGHHHRDSAYIKSVTTPTPYPAAYTDTAVQDNSVMLVMTCCDTCFVGRNSFYPRSKEANKGTIGEVLFDVMTITDDDRLVCTRIGYGNDRQFYLKSIPDEQTV